MPIIEPINKRKDYKGYYYQHSTIKRLADEWEYKTKVLELIDDILKEPTIPHKMGGTYKLYYKHGIIKEHHQCKKSVMEIKTKPKQVVFHNIHGRSEMKARLRTVVFNHLITKGFKFFNKLE